MARGVFISFESSEGCGKSTQIELLRKRLEGHGLDLLLTREPGGTPIGEKVRDLIQYSDEAEFMASETELLLFAASRAQLVREIISPALAIGQWVVADRFLDSTTVYQGVGRALAADAVEAINQFAVGDCLPDLTVLLDMDVAVARERALLVSDAEGVRDRMEHLDEAFYERVRNGYRELAQLHPDRMVMINAADTPEAVGEAVWEVVNSRFELPSQ